MACYSNSTMKKRLRSLSVAIRKNSARTLKIIALVLILLAGVGMRVYQFPNYPEGLNQDEASAAYESYSLLQTGKDRWGYGWPVYFLGWGSGQNVLLSYLSLPSIALFGLTPFAIRLIPLLLAIATLPLLFYAVRKWHGTNIALMALLIMALTPWHVLLSRWGLESNILPFFMMLGVALVTYALHAPKKRSWVILFSLIPFALGLYAYGIFSVVLPIFALLVTVFYWKYWVPRWKWWVGAALIAITIALPFGLFALKNYVLHREYSFESSLPFTIPLMTESRLEQIRGEQMFNGRYVNGDPINNLYLIVVYKLNDGMVYDNIGEHPPLPVAVLLLSVAGLAATLWAAIRSRGKEISIFLLWFLSVIPLLFIAALNTVELNTLFIPIIVLASVGVFSIATFFRWKYWTAAVLTATCVYIIGFSATMYVEYFSPANAERLATNYNPGLNTAIPSAVKHADGKPLYIGDDILLNYVQFLFNTKTPPAEYQKEDVHPKNPDFKNFYFNGWRIPNGTEYYVLRAGYPLFNCKNQKIVEQTNSLMLFRCGPRSPMPSLK